MRTARSDGRVETRRETYAWNERSQPTVSEDEVFVSEVARALLVLFLVATAAAALGLFGALLVDRVSLPVMLFLYLCIGVLLSGVFAVALFDPLKPRRPRR
jgi:hypothetical protein